MKPDGSSLSSNRLPGETWRVTLLADFNLQNLAVLLQKNAAPFRVQCELAPFGQTTNLLLDRRAEVWTSPCDALLIWTSPDRVIAEFGKALSFQEFSMSDLLAEVDSYAALVQGIPESIRTVVLPTWVLPQFDRGLGPLDLANGVGIANILMQMNLRLAERCQGNRRVILLDTQRWLNSAGASAYSPKLWYLSKTPFHLSVFQEAAKDVLAVLNGLKGRNKKVLILDLDNTLWGGIVGEVGWEKLRLGGHDPVGEAFVDFQRHLKRLTNRGVLLAVCSRNEEAVALNAIQRHPEMVLRLEDFAAWRIDWRDKAQNIVELLTQLNLGADSAVFIDDSPFERARVKEALPQILVPDLPADPIEYPSFLARLTCFDSPFLSQEDRARTSMYVADRNRLALKAEVQSLEEWLGMLDLRVVAEILDDANLERAAQLFNKTNQMNLSTRRLTAPELLAWSKAEGHRLWTFRVCDKFGDYGLCGISSLVLEGRCGRLLDFLLSCRVMGRGVEETMLCVVAEHARSQGCQELYTEFIPSSKNQPCERWFRDQPQLRQNNNAFHLSLQDGLAFPRHVRFNTN